MARYGLDRRPGPWTGRHSPGILRLVLTGLVLGSHPTLAWAAGILLPDDPGVVKRGAEVYAAHCASCHGKHLEGQPEWRKRGEDNRLPAPPHDETGHTWHHPDRLLFRMTKYGPSALVRGGYESNMPGFEGVLSDADILATLSYIKSTWPEEIRKRHDSTN